MSGCGAGTGQLLSGREGRPAGRRRRTLPAPGSGGRGGWRKLYPHRLSLPGRKGCSEGLRCLCKGRGPGKRERRILPGLFLPPRHCGAQKSQEGGGTVPPVRRKGCPGGGEYAERKFLQRIRGACWRIQSFVREPPAVNWDSCGGAAGSIYIYKEKP